jgi:dehydratase family protein
VYRHGHLTILKGNLSPEGCLAKIAGLKQTSITGPARVFDSEPECLKAIMAKKIKEGDVVVIRYEGPKGGPGTSRLNDADGEGAWKPVGRRHSAIWPSKITKRSQAWQINRCCKSDA